jgi:hypothetical protein
MLEIKNRSKHDTYLKCVVARMASTNRTSGGVAEAIQRIVFCSFRVDAFYWTGAAGIVGGQNQSHLQAVA